MNDIQPPGGLLELPGMKGTIAIRYDLTRGDVQVDFGGCDLRIAIELLLSAAKGAVGEWRKIDERIIRPQGGGGSHDQQETSSKKADDDNHGGGAAV